MSGPRMKLPRSREAAIIDDGTEEAAPAGRTRRKPVHARSSHGRRDPPSRGRRGRGRRDQAAARTARHRADRASHAGAARCGGEQPARRDDGAAAPAGHRTASSPRASGAASRRRCAKSICRCSPPIWRDSFPAQNIDDAPRRLAATCPGAGRRRPLGLAHRPGRGQPRMALLAHCVSFGVNALYERRTPTAAWGQPARPRPPSARGGPAGTHRPGSTWSRRAGSPTVANYLGRVTKAASWRPCAKGRGDRPPQLIDHLKKGDMAKEAERLLAATGWLPEPLRLDDLDVGPQAVAQRTSASNCPPSSPRTTRLSPTTKRSAST